MATTSTSNSQRKKAHTTHETIHRPWTNPNRIAAQGVTPLSNKSRIRDIQRRLRLEASRAQKPEEPHIHEQRRQKEARLPADKQRDYERELAELTREDAVREAEKRRNNVMKRYKKVKFIEAKKAERRWKAARKAFQESESEAARSSAQQALHVAEVDRNYVKYCPLGWTYVSLYASEDKDDADADSRRNKGDPDMWKRIEQAMKEKGALDRVKNELVITMNLPDETKTHQRTQDRDDDSDGDFFE